MSTEQEQKQKTETTCNPCDSVVTIHVNKEAICGDSGKPKVDNKTISYNEDGDLQRGGTDNGVRKFYIQVEDDSMPHLSKTFYGNEINSGGSLEEIKVEENIAKTEYNKGVYQHAVSEIVDSSDGEGRRYVRSSYKGYYMFNESEEFSQIGMGSISKSEYMEPTDSSYSFSLSGSNNNYGISLNELEGGKLELYNKTGSVSITTPINGGATLQVDKKHVVRSINGLLANEAGDVMFEEFPNGVVLQSPNQSKYRVTVGDDGALTTTKIN